MWLWLTLGPTLTLIGLELIRVVGGAEAGARYVDELELGLTELPLMRGVVRITVGFVCSRFDLTPYRNPNPFPDPKPGHKPKAVTIHTLHRLSCLVWS